MRPIVNTFLKGLFFALPLVFTFGLVYWLFFQAENLLKIPLQWVLPEGAYITGMGVISAVGIIFVLGILVQAYVTKRLLNLFQELVAHTPLVKTLYTTARDFFDLFSGQKEKEMQGVVAITLDNDIRLIGFVTSDDVDIGLDGAAEQEELIAVYFPMSYQVGGYTAILPKKRVEFLGVSVKSAMQKTLTAHITKTRSSKSL